MKVHRYVHLLGIVPAVALLLVACAAPPAPATAPVATRTRAVAEPTMTQAAAPTASPAPTGLPGAQVLPVASLANSIPWLPVTPGEVPMSVYYGFNFQKPPFNVPEVRRAFAAAVDREAVAAEATGFKFQNVQPATTLTPGETLGRDLYGDVGIAFDPAAAQSALAEAGYAGGAEFPSTTLVVYTRGEAAPGAYYRMAKSISAGWLEILGVTVVVDAVANPWDLPPRFATNPPEMYLLAWGADVNDPDNFLNKLLHSSSESNYGRFSSSAFDTLVTQAAGASDPAERQLLYIEAERVLTEEEVGVIPLFHTWYYQQL
jgi:ABC-type oligopeptide transport system substrate-binding subunit